MNQYILNALLDIERELVVGDEKEQAPKTLARVRALANTLAAKINCEREKQMIADAIAK